MLERFEKLSTPQKLTTAGIASFLLCVALWITGSSLPAAHANTTEAARPGGFFFVLALLLSLPAFLCFAIGITWLTLERLQGGNSREGGLGERAGLSVAMSVSASVFLVSSGLCGLNFAAYSAAGSDNSGLAGPLMFTGAIELIGMAGSFSPPDPPDGGTF